MALATFNVSIDLSGNAPLDPSLRRVVTTVLPTGYVAFQPEFYSLAQIVDVKMQRQRLYNYQPAGSGLDLAAGFTDTRVSVQFVNCPAQWRREQDSMVYLGGTVDVTIRVRIVADERTSSRGTRHRCFALLYNHELLHVRDEIDIAANWLRAQIEADAFVRQALTVGNRMPVRQFEENIRPSANGSGSYLESRIIREVYLPESSRRSLALHQSRPRDTSQLSACLA